MRGSNTGELIFDNLFVPRENLLGNVDQGVKVLMEGLDIERLVLSAGPIGQATHRITPAAICSMKNSTNITSTRNNRIMQSALDLVLPYTHSRRQFSNPIAHNQLVQGKLADMYTKLSASRAYTSLTASRIDSSSSGTIETKDCAGCILYAAERATECALDAVQLMGGMGYMNEVPAGRLLRDAKLYEIGAGTSEIRRMVIGRAFNKEFAGR